jgi:uracil phosphoribosyltransferase
MMARAHTIPDSLGLYEKLTRSDGPPDQLRLDIFTLSTQLAAAARAAVASDPDMRVLCTVILRGGMLLYPGFSEQFAAADFCLLGMRRAPSGSVDCSYMTSPDRADYDMAVLVDCVAATGGTLLTARRVLAESCRVSSYVAALLCSSHRATEVLVANGVDVLGFGLAEQLDGNVVTPDLGEADCGDLFSGVSRLLRAVPG